MVAIQIPAQREGEADVTGRVPGCRTGDARDKREAARRLVAAGVDPAEHRKAVNVAQAESTENTLVAIAREWFGSFSKHWVAAHADKIIRRLELNVFPYIGSRPVKAITAPELLAVLRRVESGGANETAHRAMQVCGRVFRYAVATRRAERDPSRDLGGALAPVKERHLASITDPEEVGALLRAIDAYEGSWITRCALRLAPLVFVRPRELRAAQWAEFDFDKGVAHSSGTDEDAGATYRSALDPGDYGATGLAAADGSICACASRCPQPVSADE